MTETYDILIAGGGMVGGSLARALAPLPLRVGVLEAVPPSAATQPSYDDRVIALSLGSKRVLDGIGLWHALAALATPIREVHVSDRGHFGMLRMSASGEGVPALGYVVEARALGAALWADGAPPEGTELLCPAEVEGLSVRDDAVEVRVRHQDTVRSLRARLLVAADGARSRVREAGGIGVRRVDYRQHAIIANVTPGREHRCIAYERFTDTGPMALLPMSEGRCALVWTVSSGEAESLAALPDLAFLARLQDRFGYRLGQLSRAGRRSTYPLARIQATAQYRPRLVVIGNAAHTLHPVAGQGLNLGLRDVAALGEVLADAQRAGRDPGSERVLEAYARWRARDQRLVSGFSEGLVRVFSNDYPPVSLGRDLGLAAVDLLPPLRHGLARRAMGLAGRQPRLARGLPL